MPSFPIPVFGACVLLFLFLRLWMLQGRITVLAGLLALCATQSLIIALAQHYLLPGARLLQPVTAVLIPPGAWLAYQFTAVRSASWQDGVHTLVPLTAIAALLVAPEFLDVFIPGTFVAYGAALLLHAYGGADAQPRTYLDSGDLPSRIWLVVGAILIASALSDVLIVIAQMAGAGYLQPWIVSIYTVGNLLVIGALSLSSHLRADPDAAAGAEPTGSAPDAEVWDLVETYMAERRPYLDPDLTLSKLSRKIGVPAKTLSATINRATEGNVSRYVNNARIDAAKEALLTGASVTTAMLSSGFNTKSNFNREFLRVTRTSPSKWLSDQGEQARAK